MLLSIRIIAAVDHDIHLPAIELRLYPCRGHLDGLRHLLRDDASQLAAFLAPHPHLLHPVARVAKPQLTLHGLLERLGHHLVLGGLIDGDLHSCGSRPSSLTSTCSALLPMAHATSNLLLI